MSLAVPPLILSPSQPVHFLFERLSRARIVYWIARCTTGHSAEVFKSVTERGKVIKDIVWTGRDGVAYGGKGTFSVTVLICLDDIQCSGCCVVSELYRMLHEFQVLCCARRLGGIAVNYPSRIILEFGGLF